MLHSIVDFVVSVVGDWGYVGIVVLMGLESCFVPFPSEVVMIPAGYLASEGKMSAPVAILMGILGSWIGALVNYYIAVLLGRPFLQRWGKYVLLTEEKLVKAEDFFRRHGEIGTFTGRLIPLVRQYISFPAGLARMNLARFLFYTGLGAGIWVSILVWIGYVAGKNKALIREYSHEATWLLLVGSAVVIAVYVFIQKRKNIEKNV